MLRLSASTRVPLPRTAAHGGQTIHLASVDAPRPARAGSGLADAEYRETLELTSSLPGCRSSKDPRLNHRHLDKLMALFGAIYWHRVDSGELQPGCKPNSPFRKRGYWANKNRSDNTSRDRFIDEH